MNALWINQYIWLTIASLKSSPRKCTKMEKDKDLKRNNAIEHLVRRRDRNDK